MGDFFNDLEKAIQRMASNVSTGVSVAAQEQKVREAYQTLGRLYYKAACSGEAPSGPAFDAQVAKIRELLASINEARRNQNVSSDEV